MTIRRPDRLDADEAERMLRADPADLAGCDEPLAGLLTAAAAPPRPTELGSEDAAVAAFRAARETGLPPLPLGKESTIRWTGTYAAETEECW